MTLGRARRKAWRRSVEAEMTNGGLRELKDSKGSLCERAEQFTPLCMLRDKYSEEDICENDKG